MEPSISGSLGVQSALVVTFLILCSGVCVSRWVSHDVAARGQPHPERWGSVFFFFAPFGLVYLLVRHRLGPRNQPPSRRERLLGTLGLPPVTALLVGTTVLPPDPFVQVFYTPGIVLALLPISYLLVWHGGYAQLRHHFGLVHPDEQTND
ncbi:hypothetical protein [Halocatena halophila]|uniref:hypothetical protein n=1 Tax=Halocatena halophila TaxID=2814576 RepID=UPI002ED179C3